MFNADGGFWFGLSTIVLAGLQVLDVVTTRYLIWYKGYVEGNKIFKKVLGVKGYNFVFNTAGGTFIDGVVRLGLVAGFAAALGGADAQAPYIAAMAAVSAAMPIRNFYLIFKK